MSDPEHGGRPADASPAPGYCRILHVADRFERGGLENVVQTLLRSHDRTRFRMDLACVHAGPAAEEASAIPGVRVLAIGAQGWRGLLSLTRMIRRERIDLVHNHYSDWGIFAARLAGRPCIETVHNTYSWLTLARRMKARYQLQLALANRVVPVSETVRDYTVATFGVRPAAKVRVIANSVDSQHPASAAERAEARRSLGVAEDVFAIGFHGRLSEEKGLDVLLDAAGRLAASHPHVLFLLAGDGPLRRQLEEQARAHGLPVRLLGHRADIGALLSAYDAFVLPSRFEGLPLALLEAMGSGLPVVATRVGGIPEAVAHDVSGLLLPGADPDALAAAIARLAADPRLRQRLGEEARRVVLERYTSERMVAEYEDLYLEVLGRRRGSRAPHGREREASPTAS